MSFTVPTCAVLSPFPRSRRSRRIRPAILLIITALFLQLCVATEAQTRGHRLANGVISASSGRLPLSFEPNRGQADRRVKYRSRGNRYELLLTDSEALLALPVQNKLSPAQHVRALHEPVGAVSIMRMRLENALPTAVNGENMLPGIVNYIAGNDPRRWKTGIETYGRVRYTGIYPGIDLVFYGNEDQLEFDFVVAPGADASHICIGFGGISGSHLAVTNDLVLALGDVKIALHRPVAYQEINGVRRLVEARFRLHPHNIVSISLGEYDHSKTLVIDPVLAYSTYLGGNFFDAVQSLAVDQGGNAYVTGRAYSCDFPTTPGSYQPLPPPNCGALQGAIFVTKINPQGTGLVYSTFVTDGNLLGSSGYGWGIAVDVNGNAYVAGESPGGLPITPGAYQPVNNAAANQGINGFVFKLNSSGSALLYSTYLGGSYGGDAIYALAIDSSGNAYVAGTALSPDFPTTPGAFQTLDTTPGEHKSFVSKLNATGSALVYSTYLVGNGTINPFSAPMGQANGIAVDSAGSAYVVGTTADEDFPLTQGVFQPNYSTDPSNLAIFRFTGYVSKLDPTGAHLLYSSYLGGSYVSGAQAVAVDLSGSAYVTGWTAGNNITTPGAFQPVAPGNNAYVVKVNSTGSALIYATYLGGSCLTGGVTPGDAGFAIAIDAAGDAFVAGQTCSLDFPITSNAIQTVLAGANPSNSAFLTELNPSGTQVLFSTYIGGSYGGDHANGIGLDGQSNVYIAGLTHSPSFPVTAGAFKTQNTASDLGNGFVSKFTVPSGGQLVVHDFALSLSSPSASISKGQSASTTITIKPSNGFYEWISLDCSGIPNWASCSFSSSMIRPGTSDVTNTLTVSTYGSSRIAVGQTFAILPFIPSSVLFCIFGKRKRRTLKFLLVGALLGAFFVTGCGGPNSGGGGGNNASSFTVKITAAAISKQHTATFAVTAN
jgi:beta-propeller repeat-containing protein